MPHRVPNETSLVVVLRSERKHEVQDCSGGFAPSWVKVRMPAVDYL